MFWRATILFMFLATTAPAMAQSDAKLEKIASSPSDKGTVQILRRLQEEPDAPIAHKALRAAIPTAIAPLGDALPGLDPDLQLFVVTVLAEKASEGAVSDLLLSVSEELSPQARLSGFDALSVVSTDPRLIRALRELAAAGDADAHLRAVAAVRDSIGDAAVASTSEIDTLFELTMKGGLVGRAAALKVLAPLAADSMRLQLLQLVTDQDPLAEAVLDALDAPLNDEEAAVALAATEPPSTAAAAIVFMDRQGWLSEEAYERVLSLLESDDPATRWAATNVLARRGDARAAEAVVAFLDGDNRGAAYEALMALELSAPEPTRIYGPELKSPEGRLLAARVLVALGAPSDQLLVRQLAGDASELLMEALSWSPGALFPAGTVAYYPGRASGEEAVTLALREVLAQERSAALHAKTSASRFIALRRAYLAGGRSIATWGDLGGVHERAFGDRGARFEVVINASGIVDTPDFADAVMQGLAAAAPDYPPNPRGGISGVPTGRVRAQLVCSDRESTEQESTEFEHRYLVSGPNPKLAGLRAQLSETPRTTRQPAMGDSDEWVEVHNPVWVALNEQFGNAPKSVSKELTSTGQHTTERHILESTCRGRVTADFGDWSMDAPLDVSGSLVEVRDWRVAPTVNVDGTPGPDYREEGETTVTDNRQSSALTAIRAEIDKHTPGLAAGIEGAYTAAISGGSSAAAHQQALTLHPEVLGESEQEVLAFQELFMSVSEGAFRMP